MECSGRKEENKRVDKATRLMLQKFREERQFCWRYKYMHCFMKKYILSMKPVERNVFIEMGNFFRIKRVASNVYVGKTLTAMELS